LAVKINGNRGAQQEIATVLAPSLCVVSASSTYQCLCSFKVNLQSPSMGMFLFLLTVLHLFWHERPTLNGTSQLKLWRNQWGVLDQRNLCTRCTCAHLCAWKKFSRCTVRCYSAVIAEVFR